MLTVRHRPDLVTPELLSWLRPFVRYDDGGRCSRWLAEGRPLPPELARVAEAVCPGAAFSGVLLQAYRDGRAVTPCHTDAGAALILSLGAPRTFRVHRAPSGTCADYDLDPVVVQCVAGTVLEMNGAFNAGWHHQIVANPGITEEKLSLVFRS